METSFREQELRENILDKNIQVISFDIFDTIIYRPVNNPTDLFYLIKEDVQKILKDPSINFQSMRTLAEEKTRELHNELEDINIHEIYEYFITDFFILQEQAQHIKELEIALEIKYAQPRKKMYEIFKLAKESGKIVILTSDMYLTNKEILSILSKCGYEGFDRIFMSSQYRKTKSSGNLYKEIIQILDISSSQMLHIGDNWHSDIEMARKSGVNCFHIPKIIDRFKQSRHIEYWDPYTEYITSYSMKFLTGLRAAKLFDNPFQENQEDSFYNRNSYNFAYCSLGPLFFSLILWILQDLRQSKHDRIFFLSRDGYLPKLIYDKMNKYFPGTPSSDYLYASRSAHKSVYLRYPWGVLKSLKDSPYNQKLDNLKGLLYTRFGLILSNMEYKKIKFRLFKETHVSSLMLFNILKNHITKISEAAKKEFSLGRSYYNSRFKDSRSPAVFDLGSLGSSIEGLCAFLGREYLPFYFLNGSYSKREALFFFGKLFVHYPSEKYNTLVMPFLEKITQSDEGTCIGFVNKKGIIQPVLLNEVENSDDTQRKHIIQRGILDFCDDCIRIFGADLPKLKPENYLVLDNLVYIIAQSTDKELSVLLDSLLYSDNFGGDVPGLLNKQILDRRARFLFNNNNSILQDRWYRFGQLSQKQKLWKIGRIFCKKIGIYKYIRPFVNVFKSLYLYYKDKRK